VWEKARLQPGAQEPVQKEQVSLRPELQRALPLLLASSLPPSWLPVSSLQPFWQRVSLLLLSWLRASWQLPSWLPVSSLQPF
jgi:hypothetical protein